MLSLRAILACTILLAPMLSGQSARVQPSNVQPDPAPWRFVHPNAKALIGIDWQRIRQTPVAAMIRDKWLNTGWAATVPGIGLLDQVDRVLISSPGNEALQDTGDGAAVEPSEAPLLIAVEGHFDATKVRRLFARLGSKPQAYNSFQVYRPQGRDSKDMAYVLFDAGTILFGDAPSVFAALDRNQFAAPVPEPKPGSIVARGAELAATCELWLVLTSPDILSNDRLAGLFGGGEWLTDTQGFEAGVHLRSGLAADVTVRFASDAAAKQMATEMTRLTAVVAKDKDNPRMQDIARRLKFSSDGPATKISLRLTPQELATNMDAFAVSHKTPAVTSTPATSVTPAAPVPARPGVIRIEGLDEGPREIPVPDHQN
jgi:hypothetical protein